MFTHVRKYQLVHTTCRHDTDLCSYAVAIKGIIAAVFRDNLTDITVDCDAFTITVTTPEDKIPHGVLVNMGKKLSANLQELSCHALKTYQVNNHPDARQLFRCVEASCL